MGKSGSNSPLFDSPLYVGRPNMGSREAFDKYVDGIYQRKWLTNSGPLVEELEEGLTEYLGVKHCIAIANGTLALEIATRAVGMSGEVIVPSFTFIATPHALSWQGISPVFCDIDPSTHNLDPQSVRDRITSRTTGILGVHLWGRPAPTKELESIADEFNLRLIYDAAHAFGVQQQDQPIASFGEASVFSFHATKFFNTFEGGAIATNDDGLAEVARLMRNFGFQGVDEVGHAGTNGKMTEICAAMGLVNLSDVTGFMRINRTNFEAYSEGLRDVYGVRLVTPPDDCVSNYQYVVLELSDWGPVERDGLVDLLVSNNVIARRYFWPGAHRMEPYRTTDHLAGRHLPNTEHVSDRVIVLPTGQGVSVAEVDLICKLIRQTVAAWPRRGSSGTTQ